MPEQPTPTQSVVRDIYATLREHFIEFKEDGTGKNIILRECPYCRDDKWHFYLATTDDINTKTNQPKLGSFNCFKCPAGGKTWEELKSAITGLSADGIKIERPFQNPYDKTSKHIDDKLTFVDQWCHALKCDAEALNYIMGRGITMETIDRYKLGLTEMDMEEIGRIKCLTIPYFYRNHLVNVKFRTIPPAPKKFVRVTGCPSILYNYDNIDLEKDYVYVCEGELDAVSLVQAGETNIVSITCGARSFLPEWYDMLKGFDRVYIVLDNDIKGQEGARQLAERLGLDKCHNIILPPDTKDLNEYFIEHSIVDFNALSVKSSTFTIESVFSAQSVFDQLERNMFLSGHVMEGYSMPWEPLHRKMGNIMGGDLIYLSGKPGVGKTTLALNIAYHFAFNLGVPVLFFCLEMQPVRLGTKLICYHRYKPKELITRDDICMTRADFGEVPFYFGYTMKKAAELKREPLFNVFREAKKKYGIGLLIFDNIHFLCRSQTHVTQEVSLVSRSFKLLGEELNIPVMPIAHPKKLDDDAIMSSSHLKDSSAMHADADFIVIVHRDKMPQGDIAGMTGTQDMEDTVLFSPWTKIIVDKARYEPGGLCELYFEGDKGVFRLPRPGDIR